jgi:predicted 3-demethylubiquinone-9 3-methyltransferase (glyoxalase superfamily)
MQKITPFLWFDDQAEEAMYFYTSIFKNSKIGKVTHYVEDEHKPTGSVMTAAFELDGVEYVALNGGPEFTFSPAISFQVHCLSQDEVDELWEKLSAGGEKGQCGWLTDKFGVSWQIVPTELNQMLSDPDAKKALKVTQVMLQMTKLDISALRKAYEQA